MRSIHRFNSNVSRLVISASLVAVGATSSAQLVPSKVAIAYLSTQSEAVVKERATAIQNELRKRWSSNSQPAPELVFDIRRFELSALSMAPVPEVHARNRAMLTSVLAKNPAIIYAAGADAAMLAKEMTSAVPIVLGCKCNPGPTSIRRLVMNLCAPEANLTGFTRYDIRVIAPSALSACAPELGPRDVKLDGLFSLRLQVLKDASEAPMKRVGAFFGDDYEDAKWQYQSKAAALGITLIPLRLTNTTMTKIPELFEINKLDGAIVLHDNIMENNTRRIVEATSKISKPTIFPWDQADFGAWMHLGTKVDLAARAVDYILPLIQGRAVKDLPVSFPTEYELVVNYELAKKHNWVFPKRFLLLPQREAELAR
jgi:ABC-type uncharacterized transport system substrate-binding protein